MATPTVQSIFSAPSTRNKPLVEFRAGKMLIRGKMVVPDKRKGRIEVNTGDDQLMHFKWKDRATGDVETDLIIFPDEAVFKKVKQCTTGRVFLLEWKTTERRLFFWMQEPSDEKDAELCEKVNKALNSPPAAEGGDAAGAAGMAGLAGMSQEQLMAMLGMGGLGGGGAGGGGGARRAARGAAGGTQQPAATRGSASAAATPATPSSTTTSSTTPARSSEATIGEQQLQNILRDLGAASGAAGQQGGAAEDVDLSSVMTSEALLPLLSNPAVAEQLMPYLPEGQRSAEELRALVRSPQFHQAIQAFNSALQSGALADVLPALGLPPSAAGGGVQAFLRALQENAQRQQQPQAGGQQPQAGGQQPQQGEEEGQQGGGSSSGQEGGDKKKDGDMDTS